MLQIYENSMLNDKEYYEKLKEILNDFRSGRDDTVYPEKIKDNHNVQHSYASIKN